MLVRQTRLGSFVHESPRIHPGGDGRRWCCGLFRSPVSTPRGLHQPGNQTGRADRLWLVSTIQVAPVEVVYRAATSTPRCWPKPPRSSVTASSRRKPRGPSAITARCSGKDLDIVLIATPLARPAGRGCRLRCRHLRAEADIDRAYMRDRRCWRRPQAREGRPGRHPARSTPHLIEARDQIYLPKGKLGKIGLVEIYC